MIKVLCLCRFFDTDIIFAFLVCVYRSSPELEATGVPIVGDAGDDFLGKLVALSTNTSILTIRAPYYNSQTGYVKTYRINNDGRNSVQLSQTIYIDAADNYFGSSVDITPDCTITICGSPEFYADDDQPGYLRVFSLEGDNNLGMDNWKQVGQDIFSEANDDQFGLSVSILEDGKTIAVGAN
jgi:hypothetical protein